MPFGNDEAGRRRRLGEEEGAPPAQPNDQRPEGGEGEAPPPGSEEQPAGDREAGVSDPRRGTEPGAGEAAGAKSRFGGGAATPGQEAEGGVASDQGALAQPPKPTPWKSVSAADLGCLLEPIDSGTLKRLINPDGRTPIAPEPAYLQAIKGLPATTYTTEEMIYSVRNPRTNRIYGYSPVEQVLTTVNIALRRQLSQLEYYTAGNIPDLILGVPETWNPDQIAQFQAWWDALLSGDTAERRKARFVPGGTTPFPLKDPKIKDEWDDWLARIICYAFSLPYQALVKEVNRATAETSGEQSAQDGLEPLKLWWKDVMDEVLEKAYDAPDMEFIWADEEINDAKTKAEVWSIAVGKPWAKPSEARKAYGMPPDPTLDAAPAPADPMAALGAGAPLPPGADGEEEDAPGAPPPFGKKPGSPPPFGKKPGAPPAAGRRPPPPWLKEKAANDEAKAAAALPALVKAAVEGALSARSGEVRFIRDAEGRITGARLKDTKE